MIIPTYQAGLVQAKAYRVLQTTISTALESHALTPAQWALLGQLYEKRSVRLSTIATILGVEAPLVSAMIDALEAKELLQRVADRTDRRAKLVVLSEKGAKLVPVIEAKLREVMKSLLSGIPIPELTIYMKVLHHISQRSA